ncbi:MAG: hypothetical protein FJ213_04390 [Ignavibacteria bacterium]|nr:hypothetical protein [Ignavibacteria bacterium]
MRTLLKKKNWKKEFDQIKDLESFTEFFCENEDAWLQYSDWGPKIRAVFGSYKNAVLLFQAINNSQQKV